jgi:hypothetical protein
VRELNGQAARVRTTFGTTVFLPFAPILECENNHQKAAYNMEIEVIQGEEIVGSVFYSFLLVI